MLKSACICAVIALAFPVSAVQAQVQAGDYQPRRARTYASDAGRTLTAPSTAAPPSIVAEFLRDRNIAVAAASLVTASDPLAAQNGMTVVLFEQFIAGLRVYGVQAKASFTPRGELVHLSENLVAQPAATLGVPLVNESQALNAVLARLYPDDRPAAAPIRREGQRVVFERTQFFHDSPTVTRVAFVAADGSIRAGLLVDTWSERQNLLHQTLVGPDGAVLYVELRTSADAYNVFKEDPAKTAQAVVPGPGAGNLQSPAGWLFAGAQNSVHVEGNNASAYLDADHNDAPDRGGSAIANGEFLTPVDLTAAPTTTRNREVSVQNLFYLNNVLHDVLYQHGFTEAAGNFQENNFNQGGRGSDSVNAEAQDGEGLDNANFATPSDGRNPRMQMFLWTGGPTLQVVINSPISVVYDAAGAAFGPAPAATGQAGDVVLVNDGTGPSVSDGCEAVQAAVRGKIALVDRGACDNVVKVANAQAAGALAVIVANNAGGDAIFTMGGTSRRIRIPAAMISQNDGAALKALTAPNATIRQHPNPPLMIDGTLDSDIVFHEYGHGLTWRMIGGMSGPLAGAIGEGASDGVAMLLNGDDRMGEYATSTAGGVRRFPYAGYPLTYGDVTGEEVHRDGEVYGAILWRLIEIFNARGIPISTLLDYFVDGMNYTPAMPAYEDMRDGILQSVANSLSGHACLIWEAFADFGVGVGASGTATGGGVAITESFAVPAACTP